MLIRIWIEGTQPLAGTAVTKGSKPLRFDGWLELLRVVSELAAGHGQSPAGAVERRFTQIARLEGQGTTAASRGDGHSD